MTDDRADTGTRLVDYPRPSLAVDTAVLTVDDGILKVALVDGASHGGTGAATARRLPGTFVHEGETLADAVQRSLVEKADIRGLRPTQLHVFDAPGRDDRGWVVSVAHLVVVSRDDIASATLADVRDARGLAFDHDEIVGLAVEQVREEYRLRPDPRRLLGDEFTLLELQRLHAAIDPDLPLRDTFRRSMLPQLAESGAVRQGIVGKPARLFRHEG